MNISSRMTGKLVRTSWYTASADVSPISRASTASRPPGNSG